VILVLLDVECLVEFPCGARGDDVDLVGVDRGGDPVPGQVGLELVDRGGSPPY
jgi:hypothetical protein